MKPVQSSSRQAAALSGTLVFTMLAAALLHFNPQASAEWGGVGGLSTPPPPPILVPTSNDSDGDGMPNTWELANQLDPANAADATSDFDMDGLTALQEYQLSQNTSGQYGKPTGRWSLEVLPAFPGYIGNFYPTLIASASNGTTLVSVSGTLVGESSASYASYIWFPSATSWLRVMPPGDASSSGVMIAKDVNSSGQVVGSYVSDQTKGFIWTSGGGSGSSQAFAIDTSNGPVNAIPSRVSDAGFVVANVPSQSSRSVAATTNGDEVIFLESWANPVFSDVNDYGEFVGTFDNPVSYRTETFLAVPSKPVFPTGIAPNSLSDLSGPWGAAPDIDYNSITWDPAGGYSYPVGTAVDRTTGETIHVRSGYGAQFYWASGYGTSGQAWYSLPNYSNTIATLNDWGEFTGTWSGSLSETDFEITYQTYNGQTYESVSQQGYQGQTDSGVFFYDGRYHGTHLPPVVHGVSNDPVVLLGTPFSLWSGSLIVPVSSLLPAGAPSTIQYARIADHGKVILQQGSQIAMLKLDQDTDGDGMPDDWEVFYGLDPNDSLDRTSDIDNDGVPNYLEFSYRTNPALVPVPGSDGQFIDLRPGIDTDGDGMPNVWEWKHGLYFDYADDAMWDFDLDGLRSLQEFYSGTDPDLWDTDGDGVSDGDEVLTNGTNPLLAADNDEDGMFDDFEMYWAKKLLAAVPDPQAWGNDYADLVGGNLDPEKSYPPGGMSASEEVAEYNKVEAFKTSLDIPYVFQTKMRRVTFDGYATGTTPVAYHGFHRVALDGGISSQEAAEDGSLFNLSSLIDKCSNENYWLPAGEETFGTDPFRPDGSKLGGWSVSVYSGYRVQQNQHNGHVSQMRVRVAAKDKVNENREFSFLKVTGIRPYGTYSDYSNPETVLSVEVIKINAFLQCSCFQIGRCSKPPERM